MKLTQMMEVAAKESKAFVKLEGDWKGQIDLINKAVNQVTEWQDKMQVAFGYSSWGFYDSGKQYRRGTGLVDGKMVPLNVNIDFKGAMILQTLQTTQQPQDTLVEYDAILKVDENWFLEQILPNVNRFDPDYNLYKFRISIPRAQLRKESLHMLDEMMSGAIKSKSQVPTSVTSDDVFLSMLMALHREKPSLVGGPVQEPKSFP